MLQIPCQYHRQPLTPCALLPRETVFTPTGSSRPCSNLSPQSLLSNSSSGPLPLCLSPSHVVPLPLNEGGGVSVKKMLREEGTVRIHWHQVIEV